MSAIDPQSKHTSAIINDIFAQRKYNYHYKSFPTEKEDEVLIQYNGSEDIVLVSAEAFARWLVGTCRSRKQLLSTLRAKKQQTTQ